MKPKYRISKWTVIADDSDMFQLEKRFLWVFWRTVGRFSSFERAEAAIGQPELRQNKYRYFLPNGRRI